MRWFKTIRQSVRLRVRRRDEDFGEFTIAEFQDWLDRGALDPTDEVCFDGTDQWVPLSEVQSRTGRLSFTQGSSKPPAPAQPRSRSVKSAALFLGPPILMVGGAGGGGLIALIILVVYIWGTIDMNRGGAREVATQELSTRIAQHVDANPEFRATSPEDILALPIITDKDRKLINSAKLVIYPVDSRSADEALVLTRPINGGERRYYMRCPTNFLMSWVDPSGQFRLVSEPQSPSNRIRVVRIEAMSGAELAEYEVEAHTVTARWRQDGQLVAINENRPDGVHRMQVFRVSDFEALPLEVPDELYPDRHLQDEDRAMGEPRWLSDQLNAVQWLDDGQLKVESYGNVVVANVERLPLFYIYFRNEFVLAPRAQALEIVKSVPVSYTRSEPTGTPHQLPPLPETQHVER